MKRFFQVLFIPLLILSGVGLTIVSAESLEDKAYEEAVAFFNQHQWDKAKTALDKFLSIYPRSHWKNAVMLRLADIEKNPARANQLYLEVIEKAEGSEWEADARWALSMNYFTLGQYQKSAEHFVNVIKNQSVRKAEALYFQGLSYLALKQYDQAYKSFQLIIESGKTMVGPALIGKGDALLAQKKYTEALSVYDRYLRNEPEGHLANRALNQKVLAYKTQNLQEDAVQIMHQLVTRFPESFEAEKSRVKLSKEVKDKFTIQVGAFSKLEYANKLEKKLRGKGYNAYKLEARHGQDVYIQVRVGSYTTKEFAQKIGEKLKSKEELPFVIVPYIKP